MDSISGKAVVLGALRAIGRLRKESREGKRLTFERHVAPVYRMIEVAHKDYVDGFLATKKAIKSSTAPSEVIDFLYDVRRGALMVRGQALVKIEQMLDEDRYGGRGLPAGWKSTKDFYEAAQGYLYGATAPAAVSWYSDYVRFVETSAKYLPGDCWEQEVFGNDPRSDLTFAIERVLDRIEIKFRVVTQQYLVTQRNLVA